MGATSKVVVVVLVAGLLLLSLITTSTTSSVLVLATLSPLLARGGGEEDSHGGDVTVQQAVKEASVEPVRTAADYARQTGEGIRLAAETAYRPLTDAVQALNRKTEQAVDAAKQTLAKASSSEARLAAKEKNKAPPVVPLKDRLAAFWFRKNKGTESPPEHHDAQSQAFQGPPPSHLKHHGEEEEEDIVSEAEEEEKAMEDNIMAGGGRRRRRRGRGGASWLQDGDFHHHHGYENGHNMASSAKAQVHVDSAAATNHLKEGGASEDAYESHAAAAGKMTSGSGWDKRYDTKLATESSATRDDVMAASRESAMDSMTRLPNRAYDKVAGMVDKSEQAVKDAGLGIVHTVNDAACKTAECLRQRAMEAGSYLPNVGQGVAYVQDKSSEALRAGGDGGKDIHHPSGEATSNVADVVVGDSMHIEKDVKTGKDGEDDFLVREEYNKSHGRAKETDSAKCYSGVKDSKAGCDMMGNAADHRGLNKPSMEGNAAAAAAAASECYKGAADELGTMAESLGWRRAGESDNSFDPRMLAPTSLLLGNTKYVWQGSHVTADGQSHREAKDFAGKNLLGHTWKRTILKRPVGLVLALARFLHLLTFATIYGSSLWVSFVSGIVLSKNIPRQQFGFVQSRMFPVYLRVVAAGEGLLFLLHSIMHPWLSADTLERQQFQNFVWMIAATLVNVYLLEPRATKVMFERLKVEKEEGRMREIGNPAEAMAAASEDNKKKLTVMNEKFKMLHSCSSAMNMITLAGLTWHSWHLSRRLII